jgi:hypothetical protein
MSIDPDLPEDIERYYNVGPDNKDDDAANLFELESRLPKLKVNLALDDEARELSHQNLIERAFDIDSILAFGKTLALVNVDLTLDLTPNPTLNLSGDIHLKLEGWGSIHKIPQFRLASFTFGSNHYDILVLLPHVSRSGRKYKDTDIINRVPDDILQIFYDTILLPTIRGILPSIEYDKWCCTWRTNKIKSQLPKLSQVPLTRLDTLSKTGNQIINAVLSKRYLKEVWERCTRMIQSRCETDSGTGTYENFQDMYFFVCGKNFKGSSSGVDMRSAWKFIHEEVSVQFNINSDIGISTFQPGIY